MDKEQKQLQQEQSELNALIRKGIEFEVSDTQVVVEKHFFGLVRKRKFVDVKRQFRIEEPTLSTLDRLSVEWIELAIDEKVIKSPDAMVRARAMVNQHAIRLARIVAIATLGVDRLKLSTAKGYPHWIEDKRKVEELTDLFARNLKPSKLHQLVTIINAMCNLGDFLNSIRLMQAERTTMPIRIEEATKKA
jgi:hypothetical protein